MMQFGPQVLLKRVQESWLKYILCLSLFLTGNLIGAVINVAPPPASIQAAIDSAANGDTLMLSAGTYIEEIQIISKTLTLVGAGRDVTIIQAPPPSQHLTQNFQFGANYYCVVLVDNQAAPLSQTVNLSQLTVSGGTQQDTTIYPLYGSGNQFFGVGYHNANGTLSNIRVTSTQQSANPNQLAGGGIINGSNMGDITFNVTDCLVDFYQVVGIECMGMALTSHLSNNTVNRGYLVSPSVPTPIGIQWGGMTTGSITGNTITGNLSTVTGVSAIGIFLMGAGPNIAIAGNTLTNNDLGIVAVNADNNLSLTSNVVNFTTTFSPNPMKGIFIRDTNGPTTLINNVMNNIPTVDMELNSTTNQLFNLSGNQFIGSETGLLVEGNTNAGPQVILSGDSFNGTVGYYIQEVTSPNNIWPFTATAYFDGIFAGTLTFAQYNQILSKIYDKHNDPINGVVLEYVDTQPPVITGVSPGTGPTIGGTNVTISGVNFLSDTTQVYFGEIAALSVTVVSDTQIAVKAPPGNGVVDVTVVTVAGSSAIVAADQFTYTGPPIGPPVVSHLYPDFGPSTGGTKVTIEGENFIDGETFVYFGERAAIDVDVIADTLIVATTPPGRRTVNVTVITPLGLSPVTPKGEFSYYRVPSPPRPPSNFIGVVRANKFLDRTEFILEASWFPSTSKNVESYLLYLNGYLIATIPASTPSMYTTILSSRKEARGLKIIAEKSNKLKSKPVSIRIIHE